MSSLEVVIFVIIVIFLGARMIRALRERKAKAEKTIPVSVDAPVASAAEPEILGPDELPPLTARLHHLEAGFAAFAASTAHPRELPEHPDFQNAVNLLADPTVSPRPGDAVRTRSQLAALLRGACGFAKAWG